MKHIISLLLLFLIGANSCCFAAQNYTYTRVVDESYAASSPVGQFSQYSPSAPVQTVQNYYDPYQNVNYVVNEPVPIAYQNIETPQSYNKRTVTTETMRDERDKADKVIERAWGVTGMLGVLGLVALGIVGVATDSHHHHR